MFQLICTRFSKKLPNWVVMMDACMERLGNQFMTSLEEIPKIQVQQHVLAGIMKGKKKTNKTKLNN